MEMEKQEQTFEESQVAKQEEEEEEEEATLQLRKTRTRTATNGEETTVEGNNGGDIEHQVQQGIAAYGTKNEDLILLQDERKVEDAFDVNGEHKSDNLVFYDKVEVISYREAEDENPSSSKLQPPEISAEESSGSYRISGEIERVVGGDFEATDYDVEGVLQKQNTHDLYCPNCKSCITRRVILRKRKRVIRDSGEEEVKKKRVEATDKVAIDGSQVPPADDDDDDDDDREPFIFKCLSCFTFFIPIDSGFRDRSGKEPVDGLQQPPSNTRKKWSFASMFSANKLEKTEEGRVKADVQIHLGDQNSQTSLSQTTVNNNVNLGSEDDNNKITPSPEKKSSSEGKGELSAANEDNSSVETFLKGPCAVINGGFQENGNGRSKLWISSDKESPSTKIPEESQKPTSETDTEDILLPASISVHRDYSETDGKIGISMAVPQEQQRDFTATIVTESIIDEKNANYEDRYSSEAPQHVTTKTQFHVRTDETLKVDSISSTITNASAPKGNDALITIDVPVQDIIAAPRETSMHPTIQVSCERSDHAREEFRIEIVKSIVYGGLAESITSLSVVSSAAGGGAKTLNILALGMANLFGGLLILCHNIWELRSEDNTVEAANQVSDIQVVPQRRGRYGETLGHRENFVLHFFLTLTSYLVFGLVPPLAYGFSFRKSDDTEGKLLVVAASSLACICLLALGRAYVQRPPKPYVKSVTTFVVLGFFVSGVSFAAGTLVERLLERLGIFDCSGSGSPAGLLVPETVVRWSSEP